ncbi:MAG TPA: lysophospholipid acyltransferase family protein [Blastocatellia bacterium]|nr:lysophospholipid acyltransferase family protein [Blastocatellia bacterium]
MELVIKVLRPVARGLCRVLFKIEFFGVENVPPSGACIITPNHLTYFDPIWITIPVKRRVFYMAWDKPFEIPGLGLLMRSFGAFPVNLDSVDSAAQRKAKDVLRGGRALVIFPEGGRTKTGKLMLFKMGAFRFALTHGVPIVPVTIEGAERVWPVGQMLPRTGRVKITYHPPIEVERLPEEVGRLELKEHARKLARKTHDVVAGALGPESLPGEDETEVLPLESGV